MGSNIQYDLDIQMVTYNCMILFHSYLQVCKEADEILGNPDDSLQDKTEKVAQFQDKVELQFSLIPGKETKVIPV